MAYGESNGHGHVIPEDQSRDTNMPNILKTASDAI